MSSPTEKGALTNTTSRSDELSMEHAHPRKQTFGTKLKNHLKRFWWLHLIIFVVCTLVIALPLILVGFPKFAQNGVNDSGLEIKTMAITEPTGKSFRLQEDTELTSDNMYHPTLDAFNASITLGGKDPKPKPFAYVTLPRVAATKVASVKVDQKVDIADLDAFTQYCVAVMNQEEYDIVIHGRTGLKQTALKKTQVTYDKTVTMKGLNKLKGFDVVSTNLIGDAKEGEPNMKGVVYIPNASVLTLEMGNLTMDLSVKGKVIGESVIENLVLKPGNNTVNMKSTTDTSKVFALLSDYPDGLLPIDILSKSSVYNGQHLTYYEEALKSNPQHVKLNVSAILSASS